MGKNNKARRAAKARDRRRKAAHAHRSGGRYGSPGPAHDGAGPGRFGRHGARREPLFTVDEQIVSLAGMAPIRLARGDRLFADEAAELLAGLPRAGVLRALAAELLAAVGVAWAVGWQPAELARQARRNGGSAMVSLASATIAADHRARGAQSIDPRWQHQIDEIVADTDDGSGGRAERWLVAWAASAGLEPPAQMMAVFELVAMVRMLPQFDELIPPPGGATRSAPSPTRDLSEADRRLLDRVRGLLAKAESSEFEAEAETFTTKAHELITRHAIDVALLAERDGAAGGDEPIAIRIPVDDPYADAKSLLLHIVAEANRCRAVYHQSVAITTVMGFPADVAATELLHTSLLVQGQAALTAAGRTAPPGARTRSRSYRSAFLVAYANRIGQRLDQINEHLTGADAGGNAALPVLRSRESQVEDAVRERFPELVQSSVRGGHDAAGWAGGRLAADSAQLAFGDLDDDADVPAPPTPALALEPT